MQPSISVVKCFSFLSSFVSPLLPLGLGVLAGSWQRSEPFVLPFWSRYGYSFCGSGPAIGYFHIYIFPFVSSRVFFSARLLSDVAASQVPSVAAAAKFLYDPLVFVVTSDLAGQWKTLVASDWQSEHSCCRHGHVSGDDSSSQSTAHAETCSVIAEREKKLRRGEELHIPQSY